MQQSVDLSCGDGWLGVSPGPASSSCSSTSHYFGPVPAVPVPETLPFECNEDHDAELVLMLRREARDAPGHNWLQTQPVLTAQHRHILVSWMQRVSKSSSPSSLEHNSCSIQIMNNASNKPLSPPPLPLNELPW